MAVTVVVTVVMLLLLLIGGATATATGGAGGAGGAGGDGGIIVFNTGDNYEDVSSSAEIEQVAEQENEACQGSTCENNLVQTQ